MIEKALARTDKSTTEKDEDFDINNRKTPTGVALFSKTRGCTDPSHDNGPLAAELINYNVW